MESMPTAYEGQTPSLADDPALGLSHRAKMEILFAVMLGLFLGALDQTIVGPALPTIVTQLSGNEVYVWAVTIYLLTISDGPLHRFFQRTSVHVDTTGGAGGEAKPTRREPIARSVRRPDIRQVGGEPPANGEADGRGVAAAPPRARSAARSSGRPWWPRSVRCS